MQASKKNIYSAFGLFIESELALPELLEGKGDPDVRIYTGTVPDQLEKPLKTGVRYQAASGKFLLKVDNVAAYYVENGNTITIRPEPGADESSLRLFLLGSAFGALLIQRGLIPLHASSVQFDDKAILFAGISGSGKSTLAAGFYKKGYAILDDDISVIRMMDGKPFVVPGYPQMKLWADTIAGLKLEDMKSFKLRENIEKHGILINNSFSHKSLPVGKIFVLNAWNKETFDIVKLTGIEKFNVVRRHTFRMQFIDGLARQADHFRMIDGIAGNAEIYRIKRPRKGFLLDELMELVINNCW